MMISNPQAVRLAIIPCVAEQFQQKAINDDNLDWVVTAEAVKRARNLFYAGFSLTALAITRIEVTEGGNSLESFAWALTAPLGAAAACFAFVRLVQAAEALQQVVNESVIIRPDSTV